MQKGDIVTIFTDAILRERPEGKARLVKRIDSGALPKLEYWKVEFLSDGVFTERWVSTEDRQLPGNPCPDCGKQMRRINGIDYCASHGIS